MFVAGAFQEPKDIPETVTQASAAAAMAMELLAPARGTMVTEKNYPPEHDFTDAIPRIGVFICHCGINIACVVDVERVVEAAKTMPYVAYAENADLRLRRQHAGPDQGTHQGAQPEPADRGVLHAADARGAVPRHRARVRAEPVPGRYGEHPRPMFVGARRRPRGRDREGDRPRADGGRHGRRG